MGCAATSLHTYPLRNIKIAVYEPLDKGHHLYYAFTIGESLTAAGAVVTLATTFDSISSACDMRQNNSKKCFDKIVALGRESRLQHIIKIRQLEVDFIFIVDLDSCLRPLGVMLLKEALFGPANNVKIGGVLLTHESAYGLGGWRAKLRKSLLWLGVLPSLLVMDEFAKDFLQSQCPRCHPRLLPHIIPKPSEIPKKQESRFLLGLRQTDFVVGMFGSLRSWKAVVELCDAFLRSEFSSPAVLLLIGKQGKNIRSLLQKISIKQKITHRIHMIDSYVEHRTLLHGIASSDVIAVTYKNHLAPASMALYAAAAGVPVLAVKYGWLQKVMSKKNIGKLVDDWRPETLSRALEEIQQQQYYDPGPGYSIVAPHNERQFANAIVDYVANLLNTAIPKNM